MSFLEIEVSDIGNAFVLMVTLIPALSYGLWNVWQPSAHRLQNEALVRRCQWGLWMAVAVLLWVALLGPISFEFRKTEWYGMRLWHDTLSASLHLMVAYLGYVLARYTVNHLDGDAQQGRFVRGMGRALAAVWILLSLGHLLWFSLAWVWLSWEIHHLLLTYRDRPGARLAAKKKFWVSRLGDLSLWTGLACFWHSVGSWDIPSLWENSAWTENSLAQAGAVWVVAAVLIKSAQLPFHSWLPETMEAPTPLSALMHAGVINAGAYLLLRLSPALSQIPTALNLLVLVGGLTALVASLVMMTQPSLKRALAWSTISQMGFLMLQCGLGAFALATLHLLAHACYKSHAFLSAGGIVERVKMRSPIRVHATWKDWSYSILGSTCLLAIASLYHPSVAKLTVADWILMSILGLAMAQLALQVWVGLSKRQHFVLSFSIAAILLLFVQGQHLIVEWWFGSALPHGRPAPTFWEFILWSLIPLLLFAIMWLQSEMMKGTNHPWLKRLYLHALNGFYLGTIWARLLGERGLPFSIRSAAHPKNSNSQLS